MTVVAGNVVVISSGFDIDPLLVGPPGGLANKIVRDVEVAGATADRDSRGSVADRVGVNSRGDTSSDVNAGAGPASDYGVAPDDKVARLP